MTAGELVDVILRMTGWTQAALVHELRKTARALGEPVPRGLDAVTINRWKQGRQTPSPYYSRFIRHLHSVVSARLRPSPPAPPGGAGSDVPRPPGEADEQKRRHFLAYLTTLAENVVVDSERWASALTSHTGVDASMVDGLNTLTRQYARQWYTAPPHLLLPVVRDHFRGLNDLRMTPRSSAVERGVQRLASEAAGLVGWEVWLTGDRATAAAYYALANQIAREVDHQPVLAFVLVAQSFLYSTLFGAPPDMASTSLPLLEQAVALTERLPSPFLRAVALLRRSEERAVRASAVDRVMVGRDLDRADAALAAVTRRADGFFHYVDQDRVAGSRGTCAMLLGNFRESDQVLTGVLVSTPPSLVAERSILLTDLAAAQAQGGEVDYACELLGQSLALGRSGDVNRVKRILGVRQTHLTRWSSTPSVRWLDEQLRSVSYGIDQLPS